MTNYVNCSREFKPAEPGAELFFRPESPADYKLLNVLLQDPMNENPQPQPAHKHPAVLEWISEPIPNTALSRRTLVVRLDTSAKTSAKVVPATNDEPMPKALDAMTKSELLEFAAKNSITVQPDWTVKKLRDEISHAGVQAE